MIQHGKPAPGCPRFSRSKPPRRRSAHEGGPAPVPSLPIAAPVNRHLDRRSRPKRQHLNAADRAAAFGRGGSIQLGRVRGEGQDRVEDALSTRFQAFLHDMNMGIEPVTSGDKTLYRLRASGGIEPAFGGAVRAWL